MYCRQARVSNADGSQEPSCKRFGIGLVGIPKRRSLGSRKGLLPGMAPRHAMVESRPRLCAAEVDAHLVVYADVAQLSRTSIF